MQIPNLYHQSDPAAPKPDFVWHFVYLHGEAEHINHWGAINNGADPENLSASYLFVSDQPMPQEVGLHMARLYGEDVVVCLWPRQGWGNRLFGRAAILTRVGQGLGELQHALTPENWR